MKNFSIKIKVFCGTVDKIYDEIAMIITDLHVQNILRAYSKQLSLRPKVSNKQEKSTTQKDQISLSIEGKKMWVIDKIAKELINQLVSKKERRDIEKEILNRLSEEYGYPLEVIKDDGRGLIFRRVEKEGDNSFLPSSENERLEKRLFEITKEMIYQQLA